MSDNDDIRNDSGYDRRKFLGGLGAGAAAGLAGCSGGGGDGGGDGGGATPTETMGTTMDGTGTPADTTAETTTETGEIVEGGKPVIGMAVAPKTLNVVQAGTVYSSYIANRIHAFGTTNHPSTIEFKPWAFTDWTVEPSNAKQNPSKPTLTATLRDDLTFHDGEKLTADDYKWTANFFKRENPSKGLNGAAHQKITKVEVQSPTEVEVYMKAKDQRWFTNILGFPILPKHIWKDVNYQEYSPRKSDAGVVGAGPWELTDFNWQNWYELEPAYDKYPPANAESTTWIESGAPFADGLRFEIFGSQSAMEQALLNNEIDGGFVAGGFTVNNAVKAERSENFTVHQGSEVGYNHVSYNVRRTPLDDVAFRQFLNKAMDKKWIVQEPYKGVGAVQGDYVVIPALDVWRPPEPEKLAGKEYQSADQFEPNQMPDLSFPNPGKFNLNESQINEIRNFLINNPNAKHDYSFGEAQTNLTRAPDGKELYVNGQHLNKAHTNNDGESMNAPLEFSFQPPQEDLYQSRTGQQYIGLLKKIGIPIEPKVKTINAQIPTIYGQEKFDIYSMGWGLGVNVTHLSALYSSEGADLKSNSSQQQFNPMGYTGADDLIKQDRQKMRVKERFPIVKQICTEIYRDAPTNITDVAQLLEPTSVEWKGWTEGLGTTISGDSFLNIHKTK